VEDVFEMIHTQLGVQFIYAEEPTRQDVRHATRTSHTLASSDSAGEDLATQMAALPSALLERLQQAIIETDLDAIESVIEAILPYQQKTADALRLLAQSFDYLTLRSLVDAAQRGENLSYA
jgi:hypothetical protein